MHNDIDKMRGIYCLLGTGQQNKCNIGRPVVFSELKERPYLHGRLVLLADGLKACQRGPPYGLVGF
jgi:hypothetical protein